MGHFGEPKLLLGTLETKPTQLKTQDLIRLLKDLASLVKPIGQIFAHAEVLGTLSGKDKCLHFSAFALSFFRELGYGGVWN